jgi:hypothetical protein
VDATAPRITLTSAGALTLTYLLDNSAGQHPAEVTFNGALAGTVTLPAARLAAGANAVTLTKTSGSWLVYDALGVYR